jgi:hypothetical protein
VVAYGLGLASGLGVGPCIVLVQQSLAVMSMLCANMLLLGPVQAVGLQLLCWHVCFEMCCAAVVFCSYWQRVTERLWQQGLVN